MTIDGDGELENRPLQLVERCHMNDDLRTLNLQQAPSQHAYAFQVDVRQASQGDAVLLVFVGAKVEQLKHDRTKGDLPKRIAVKDEYGHVLGLLHNQRRPHVSNVAVHEFENRERVKVPPR